MSGRSYLLPPPGPASRLGVDLQRSLQVVSDGVDRVEGGEGVLAGTIAPGVVRLVTHHDVDDEGLERALAALAGAPA